MRHVYHCPMRWADLDLMGHVNNVLYVDYLQEARVDMLRVHSDLSDPDRSPAALAEGVVVVSHEIDYLAPVLLRDRPLRIECWVTSIRAASFTIGYEIYQDDDGAAGEPGSAERRVCARASTVLTPFVFATGRPRRIGPAERELLTRFLADTPPPAPLPCLVAPAEAHCLPVRVRFSDVDVYGHVNNVKYLEYFQEGRIAFARSLWGREPRAQGQPHLVVARTEVDYRSPILFRNAPYDVRTWLTRVGTKSFVVQSEIRDDSAVLASARVLMVFVDPASGAAQPMTETTRERLLAGLAEAGLAEA